VTSKSTLPRSVQTRFKKCLEQQGMEKRLHSKNLVGSMQGVKNLHGSDFVEHKKLSIVHYRKTLANCKFLGVVIKDYN